MRSRSSCGTPGPRSATSTVASCAGGGHADRAAAAVAQRVVDQDPHDAGDRVGVAAAPARAVGRDDLDRGVALAGAQPELGRHGARELAELDRLRAQRDRGVEPREVEQLLGERREALQLAPRGGDLALRVGDVGAARRRGPPRAAPSCPGASSAACAARATRSPRTRAAPTPGGAAPPACARARGRGRRPRRGRCRAASRRSGPRSRSAARRRAGGRAGAAACWRAGTRARPRRAGRRRRRRAARCAPP